MKLFLYVVVLLLVLSSSLSAQDTVHVEVGWNNIGSVTTGAVPGVVCTAPPDIIVTAFFGYEPGAGYQTADTLKKGLGYWVKVSADGILVFNGTCGGGGGDSGVCSVPSVSYAGKTYNTVAIGSQCWLKENLDVGTMISGLSYQSNNFILEKYCYNDSLTNCSFYGGLYQWDEAMQYQSWLTQGICPPGWHIPAYAEFVALKTAVGEDGNALKREDQGGGIGMNTSGFSGLLAGYRFGGFADIGLNGGFWSSTAFDGANSYNLSLYSDSSTIYLNGDAKELGLSVRCLED